MDRRISKADNKMKKKKNNIELKFHKKLIAFKIDK
jgi:hypothetical protein